MGMSADGLAKTTWKGDLKTMDHNRRRFFSVTSSLQYRFLAMTLAASFIIVAFFATAVFLPDVLEMQNQNLGFEARSDAATRVLEKNAWVWPAVFSLIILLGLHSFSVFQRFIGPLYRFRCAFEELENGKIVFPLRIRKKDYLHGEEEAFNKMLATLIENLEEIKASSDNALESLKHMEQIIVSNPDSGKILLEVARNHREQLERLSAAVGFFELENDTG
jgi:hypothetical protein